MRLSPTTRKLADQLKMAGYKLTPARKAILQVVDDQHAHLNPADVLARARDIYPKLGRATVYRTLELLTELGILRPIYTNENAPRFIRVEGGHHHLVCNECGDIIEFEECVANDLTSALQRQFGFQVDSHLLELYGLCAQCH